MGKLMTPDTLEARENTGRELIPDALRGARFKKVRFGVNYTPTNSWWYCWNHFERDSIAADLDSIAGIQADHIRIFPIWPYFQPNPSHVSEAHLDRLETLLELAAERNLDVCVAMLTGWLSGWAFRPPFTEGEDFFRSDRLYAALEVYFRSCAGRLNRHINFLGFDLGNEINYCWRTDDLDEGDFWMARVMDLCETITPGRVHVNGVDHQPWFRTDTFSPAMLATRPDLVAIHSWIGFTGALRHGTALQRSCLGLAPAMAALARAHAGDPEKPVWLQEFGASLEWMDAADIPTFLEHSTYDAVEGGICWLTWWASHDIDRKYQFTSLEYDLGLISVDRKCKEAGRMFKRLATELAGREVRFPTIDLPTAPSQSGYDGVWDWLKDYQGRLDAIPTERS